MRIARVLHAPAPSLEIDAERAPTPTIALERDGALYDVAELEGLFGSPPRRGGDDDFHARVIALGAEGLGRLDERLLGGERPTAARLPPSEALWLPPCANERCAYVQAGDGDPPRWRFANARGLVGHDAIVV